MKRRACQWCVRAACSCGWDGYRRQGSKAACARCGRSSALTWSAVRHKWSTVCHFTPVSKLIPW